MNTTQAHQLRIRSTRPESLLYESNELYKSDFRDCNLVGGIIILGIFVVWTSFIRSIFSVYLYLYLTLLFLLHLPLLLLFYELHKSKSSRS